MKKFVFPYINMPEEFLDLLKSNLSITSSSAPIFDIIRPNKALYSVLNEAFREFDDGRGLEKLMLGLGWPNFRERMASLYVYRTIHGSFPGKTSMELVNEINAIESRFGEHGLHSNSRAFLLGFYLKLANLQYSSLDEGIQIPPEVEGILNVTQGRSERIDWLILTVLHLNHALGAKALLVGLKQGKHFNEFYELMDENTREWMHNNLLAYAASIREPDILLYEKV